MPTESATFGMESAPFEYTVTWDTDNPILCEVEIEQEGGGKISIKLEDLMEIASGSANHICFLMRSKIDAPV